MESEEEKNLECLWYQVGRVCVKPRELCGKDRKKVFNGIILSLELLNRFKTFMFDDFNDEEFSAILDQARNCKPDSDDWDLVEGFIKILSNESFEKMIEFYQDETDHLIDVIKLKNVDEISE
jgi:hypothetical protein